MPLPSESVLWPRAKPSLQRWRKLNYLMFRNGPLTALWFEPWKTVKLTRMQTYQHMMKYYGTSFMIPYSSFDLAVPYHMSSTCPPPRLCAALQASVTSLEEVHLELSNAYSNGVVDGFKPTCLGLSRTLQCCFWSSMICSKYGILKTNNNAPKINQNNRSKKTRAGVSLVSIMFPTTTS